jgi:hypothetical protein
MKLMRILITCDRCGTRILAQDIPAAISHGWTINGTGDTCPNCKDQP